MKKITARNAVFFGALLFMVTSGWTCDRDGDSYPNESIFNYISGNTDAILPYIDCDDDNATVYPGAVERCDGLDNDCDGDVSDAEVDEDGDLYLGCEDCDDTDPLINPGEEELCDGIDNNCDGELILGEDLDSDGDGILNCAEEAIEAVVEIKPEVMNLNTGTFTAMVALPEGYDPASIIECYADGAAAVKINIGDNVAVCKFNRDDITELPLDINFEVWGVTADGEIFLGTDEISKIK